MPTDDVIAKLKADALAAAAAVPLPKNPRAFELADKLLALSDDFLSGRKQPSPRARAIAQDIRSRADRIMKGRWR